MKKYIKYTESNGEEVNKEYSDEEFVRVLQQQQEIQNKSHTQMAVMCGVDVVNYPHLKKQASEETSLKAQASSPQALSFPAYPGDILCHVCKRDPVARQATPVFHR